MGEWTAELRKIAAVDKLGIQGRGRGGLLLSQGLIL
jgi:prolyl oligopeptidase PreP (S9A serine peptidase family)